MVTQQLREVKALVAILRGVDNCRGTGHDAVGGGRRRRMWRGHDVVTSEEAALERLNF